MERANVQVASKVGGQNVRRGGWGGDYPWGNRPRGQLSGRAVVLHSYRIKGVCNNLLSKHSANVSST